MSRPDQYSSDREIVDFLERSGLIREYANSEQGGFKGYYDDAIDRYRSDARAGHPLRRDPSTYRNPY